MGILSHNLRQVGVVDLGLAFHSTSSVNLHFRELLLYSGDMPKKTKRTRAVKAAKTVNSRRSFTVTTNRLIIASLLLLLAVALFMLVETWTGIL